MLKKQQKKYQQYLAAGLSDEQKALIEKELGLSLKHHDVPEKIIATGLYDTNDLGLFIGTVNKANNFVNNLQTLDELLERDKRREADGLPRRIRIGKFIKPTKGKKEQIVVVPTTTEPKFYHDNSVTEEGEETGGSGDGEEGEVIAEQPAEPQEGEGEGQGAGQGDGTSHDISSEAFDLGKVLTEKFELPNLKVKGKKPSLSKYQYDLTDKNRGFGQLLDQKATIKKIIETNILLGKIKEGEPFTPDELVINPQDQIFRILSKEKDYEAQAVVFFVRDYSGSMQGKPTEAIVSQHLLIYSWLMYVYKNQVQVRFILHDTEAKEVPDFYTYYKSAVAGGTTIFPAYELVNKIIADEQLVHDNNIYVFHGTDGDDWEEEGDKAVDEIKKLLLSINRMGITVAKNSWTTEDRPTVVENYLEKSNLLKERPDLIKMDSFSSTEADEGRIIESIKKLIC
jgi:uncharacterized sporulation protein YeaH/YhbH (DUF444 family)